MNKRGSGILLHITSLPSPYGIGDIGPSAYKFADFLADTKQQFWQVLPLNRTFLANSNSPYSSVSAFAGNPLLISPELMIRDGLITNDDILSRPNFPVERVDYPAVIKYKNRLLHSAYKLFKLKKKDDYEAFAAKNADWLEDFALFLALKGRFIGRNWSEWPREFRDRDTESLKYARRLLSDKIEDEKFFQYLFYTQWFSLKNYCNQKGIQIIGDVPIYVDRESVDVWNNPELFKLDDNKMPISVSGVPPDYYSKTGQLWGNPVYRWDILKETGYAWWIKRLGHNLRLFDLVRIDHFRGFAAYWEVPATEKTAINGKWVEGAGEDFFNALFKHFPSLPVIAEDLGVITDDVRELIRRFSFPGMKILLFAFGGDLPTNPYAPHNCVKNCLVYTGTHDNNTVKGWFEKEMSTGDKERLFQYLGRRVNADEIHWVLIRLAMMSVANTTIFPMQDIMGLGEEARMNLPATTNENWEWRLTPEQLTPQLSKDLLEITKIYGRT